MQGAALANAIKRLCRYVHAGGMTGRWRLRLGGAGGGGECPTSTGCARSATANSLHPWLQPLAPSGAMNILHRFKTISG